MKRLSVVVLGMVVLWACATSASAQGFIPSGGAPSLTGLFSNWPSGIYDARNTSWHGLTTQARVYFGWLEHPKGSIWSLVHQDSIGTAPWPLRGFWLGATKDFTLESGFGALVSGSVFFQQRGAGMWFEEPAGRSFDFEIPSHDWWSVDGLGKCPISRDLDFLAGFRWDHVSTRVNYSDNTSDDYILNAYIPLIGLRIHHPSSTHCFLLRSVGFPVLGGRIRYHFWDRLGYAEFGDFDVTSGYFLEFLADYTFNTGRDLNLGGFAKWNALRVKTSERSLSGSTTEPVSWVVDITSWTIGGTLSLGFYSPI